MSKPRNLYQQRASIGDAEKIAQFVADKGVRILPAGYAKFVFAHETDPEGRKPLMKKFYRRKGLRRFKRVKVSS